MPNSIERKLKRGLIQLLKRIFPSPETVKEFDSELKSVVIIAQEKLGDGILLTPLIRQLKYYFPHCRIDIACMGKRRSPVLDFFEYDQNVHYVYRVKENYARFLREIRSAHYDLLFNTKDHPSYNFLLLSSIIRARVKVGIFHKDHTGFFSFALPLEFHAHVIEKNCALLKFLGKEVLKDCRPYLPDGPVSESIQSVCHTLSNQRVIGVNLSAGDPRREWTMGKWCQLIHVLGSRVIIFAMPDREPEKLALENAYKNVLPTPATRNIYEVGMLIKNCAMIVTPDTSLVHVASCYQVPVIGLYTGEIVHQSRFRPYGIDAKQIFSSSHTVKDISVQQVIHAIKDWTL